MLFWTLRLTISGAGASPFARSRLVSNAIARSTCGSPVHRANAKARRPATTPTSIPRRSRVRMIKASYLSLVAGKAEQMATIVKEFVDGSAVDERRRSLLRTDEID